jgi:hypothetical protein
MGSLDNKSSICGSGFEICEIPSTPTKLYPIPLHTNLLALIQYLLHINPLIEFLILLFESINIDF